MSNLTSSGYIRTLPEQDWRNDFRCVCVWGGGGQTSPFSGPGCHPQRPKIHRIWSTFFKRTPIKKKNRTKYFSDFQEFKHSAAQDEPLQNRKKSPDLTHFFESGPFLNTSGPPGLSQESTFSGPGEMVPHGPHGFPSPAQNPSQITLKKSWRFRQE